MNKYIKWGAIVAAIVAVGAYVIKRMRKASTLPGVGFGITARDWAQGTVAINTPWGPMVARASDPNTPIALPLHDDSTGVLLNRRTPDIDYLLFIARTPTDGNYGAMLTINWAARTDSLIPITQQSQIAAFVGGILAGNATLAPGQQYSDQRTVVDREAINRGSGTITQWQPNANFIIDP